MIGKMATDKSLANLWNFQKMEQSAKIHSYQIFERLKINLLQVINKKAAGGLSQSANVFGAEHTPPSGGHSSSPLGLGNLTSSLSKSNNGLMFE